MKRRIVSMMLSSVLATTTIVSSTVSCNSTTCGSITCNNITSNSMIDNKQIQDIDEMTEIKDNVQIYHIRTIKDFDRLTHIIENRNGKIIIEVSSGTVLDNNGNGVDICGYYRHYDTKNFSEGEHVQSVFIYNPDTNYVDDIIYRMDTLIK